MIWIAYTQMKPNFSNMTPLAKNAISDDKNVSESRITKRVVLFTGDVISPTYDKTPIKMAAKLPDIPKIQQLFCTKRVPDTLLKMGFVRMFEWTYDRSTFDKPCKTATNFKFS